MWDHLLVVITKGINPFTQRYTAHHIPSHHWPYGVAANGACMVRNARVSGGWGLIHFHGWCPPRNSDKSPQQYTPLGQDFEYNDERGCISEWLSSSIQYHHLTIWMFPWFCHLEHHCCRVFDSSLPSLCFVHHWDDSLGVWWYPEAS